MKHLSEEPELDILFSTAKFFVLFFFCPGVIAKTALNKIQKSLQKNGFRAG